MTKFLGVSMIVLGTVILLLSYLSQANDAVAAWFPVSLVDINGVQFIAFFNLIIGGLIAHVYGIKNAAKNEEEGKNGSGVALTSIILGVIAMIFAAASLITHLTGSLPIIQKDAELVTAQYEKQNEFASTLISNVEKDEKTLEEAKGMSSVAECIAMQEKLSKEYAASPNDEKWYKVDAENIEIAYDRMKREYQSLATEYAMIQDPESYKAEYAKLHKSIIDPVKNDTSLTEGEKAQAIKSMALVEPDSISYEVFSKKYFKQYMSYLEDNKQAISPKDIEEVGGFSNFCAQIKGVFFSITGGVYIPALLILVALVTTMIALGTKKKSLGYASLGLLFVGLIIAFITCIQVYPNA